MTCNCSLAGTQACNHCTANKIWTGDSYPYSPTTVPYYQPKIQKIKRKTKTIEKWGGDGEYLGKEVIIEEIEDIEREVYGNQWSFTISTENTVESGPSFYIN